MLPSGARLGPYEVIGPLGAGGMGEVYRARDTKLGRDVALKILPEGFTSDPDRLARFEREAKVLAALNHANIGHIYGLEESGGTTALVLELVQGETLADRLARGRIPTDEARPLFIQIAEGLEAAHERGVVHRDLKPANVKITPEGNVKILDFGLATAFVSGTDAHEGSRSPTMSRDTALGTIMGTAPYMSPEQARGKPVDKRTDVWAFGCCLYEALTGRRAFEGETVSDIVGAILRDEPPWDAVPAPMARLLRRCLRKDPRERLRDVGDARLELEDPGAEGTPASPRVGWRSVHWAAGVVGLVVGSLLTFVFVGSLRPPPPADVVRGSATAINLPGEAPLAPIPALGVDSPKIAVSPAGDRVVYAGRAGQGTALFQREIDRFEVSEIPGTEGAIHPFFSPDGNWVGFLTNDKLKKVTLDGNPPITLSDVASAPRARWPTDDAIFVVEGAGQHLFRVPAEGGAHSLVADMTAVFSGSRWASVSDILPGGRAALVAVWSSGMSGDYAEIHRVSLETLETERLVQRAYDARLVGNHHMTFVRGGSLFSVAWDRDHARVSGEPRSVVAGVRMDSILGQAQYALSAAGTLVYVPGDVQSVGQVARVDRSGRAELLDMPERTYCGVAVAPDGKRLAVSVADVEDYVWIYDIERREGRRLAAGTAAVWTPDGGAVAFSAVDSEGVWRIRLQSVAGGEGPRDLYTSARRATASSWSADGLTLAFYEEARRVGFVSVDGGPSTPDAGGPQSYELFPSFSPDGRWVAFGSLNTGRREVWVRSHPDGSRERQISVDQGVEPVWCENGELFYRVGSQWMVTSVTTQPELAWDPPRRLFAAEFIDTPSGTWDVSPDGKYVYLLQPAGPKLLDRLHVMTNAFGVP